MWFLFFSGFFISFIFLFHHVLFNFIISIELIVNQFLYFLLYNKSFLAFFFQIPSLNMSFYFI